MGFWSHLVIEGHCFALTEEPPCGKPGISEFCLTNGHCPHFYYASSNEREAALFVPLGLILADRLGARIRDGLWTLKWHLWKRWRYNDDWLDNIAVVECPGWEKQLADETDKFEEWLSGTE